MSNAEIKNILHAKRYKATPARIAILSLFSEGCNPMSADTVFNKLRKKVNLATVHRALGSFEAAGIIKQVDLHKNAVFYELADAHHHHIVCSVCGRTEEIEGCTIDSLLKKMLHKCSTFAYVKGHSLELFGICRKCM